MQLARDMGITVEERHIPLEELAEIDEAGACGTAAVASPVAEIHDIDKLSSISWPRITSPTDHHTAV